MGGEIKKKEEKKKPSKREKMDRQWTVTSVSSPKSYLCQFNGDSNKTKPKIPWLVTNMSAMPHFIENL